MVGGGGGGSFSNAEMVVGASGRVQTREGEGTLGGREGVQGSDRVERWDSSGGEEEHRRQRHTGEGQDQEEAAAGCVSVLIDDSEKLRPAWEAAGGVFIRYCGQDPDEVLESIQEASPAQGSRGSWSRGSGEEEEEEEEGTVAG